MYILSADGRITVNTTSITSIEIEPVIFEDEGLNEKYPEAYGVNAYGKGDKIYRMGVYEDLYSARLRLMWFHDAMKASEKTFKF